MAQRVPVTRWDAMWTLPNVPDMSVLFTRDMRWGLTFTDDLAERVSTHDGDLVRRKLLSKVLIGVRELLSTSNQSYLAHLSLLRVGSVTSMVVVLP